MKIETTTNSVSNSSTETEFNWESAETVFKDLSSTQRLEWLETCIHEFLALRQSVGLPFPVRENDRSY